MPLYVLLQFAIYSVLDNETSESKNNFKTCKCFHALPFYLVIITTSIFAFQSSITDSDYAQLQISKFGEFVRIGVFWYGKTFFGIL